MTTLNELQSRVREVNIANGWREHDDTVFLPRIRAKVQIAELALIITEVSEAIEEIRNGRDVDEAWYSARTAYGTLTWGPGEKLDILDDGVIGKPEGVPSELADVLIRIVDFADKWNIPLAESVDEKLTYNATRGYRHGGKVA